MTETLNQFESGRLKVERAYRHIQELESILDAFLKTDFCRLLVQGEPHAAGQQLVLSSVGAPPRETTLILGDVVHNLRTALDHAIVQILGKRGNRETFPVGKERHNVEAHSTYQLIKKVLPDLARLMLDEMTSHDTGKPSIWAVSKIDNIDKHNLLIVVTSVQYIRGHDVIDEANNCGTSGIDFALDQGSHGPLMIFPPGSDVKIRNPGTIDAKVLFGNGQPLEGRPVLESLTTMAELTLKTIQTLELFWFGQLSKG